MSVHLWLALPVPQNSIKASAPAITIDVMCVSSFGHNSLLNPQIGWSMGFSFPGQSMRHDAFMILYSCKQKYIEIDESTTKIECAMFRILRKWNRIVSVLKFIGHFLQCNKFASHESHHHALNAGYKNNKDDSLTGKLSPCWKCATGTMCKSQEKFSRVILYGLSAKTEKLPSESPLLSIFMVEPVTPVHQNSI